jgi:hypothetical protein
VTAAPAAPVPAATAAASTRAWPVGAIFRDIVLAGIAALVVGIVVGGIGGRLAMRVIALLVPDAAGLATEGGNIIGRITAEGTLFLVMLIGSFGTFTLATIWVVISPWLPRRRPWRALAAVPVALALGAPAMVQRENVDFLILGYDLVVLGVLLVVVAATAPAMVIVEGWLDRRLPPGDITPSTAATIYGILGAIGASLGAIIVAGLLTSPDLQAVGVIVLGVGLATLAWWSMRLKGATEPPRTLLLAGRGLLVAGTLMGLIVVAPELMGAVGIR